MRATELAQLNPALSGPGAGATPRQTAEHSRLQISVATASLRTTAATRNGKPTLTGEPYEAYIRRIADAPGPAGRLARTVKLADLEDHLAHTSIPSDAPPYAWTREQLLTAPDQAVQVAPGTPSRTRRPAERRKSWGVELAELMTHQ